MGKKVLVINGHPDANSLNNAIADVYESGARRAGVDIWRINIRELNFNQNLEFGYRKDIKIEDCLKDAIDKLKQADHILFVHPLWWGSYPSIMKGFIDRTFLPGVTFDHDSSGKRKMLLKGKSARIIMTMECPEWYYKYVMFSPATRQLKDTTLGFCGIRDVRSTYFCSIASSTQQKREKWLKHVENLGFKEVQ